MINVSTGGSGAGLCAYDVSAALANKFTTTFLFFIYLANSYVSYTSYTL